MKFKEYQEEALKTATYKDENQAIVACLLGLTGEAGEVAEKFKKHIRKEGLSLDVFTLGFIDSVAKEIGDVLWYVAALSHYLGIDLEHIAKLNIKKLNDRKERGVIQSEGDNR